MRLESGPAKADRNWHLVRALFFLAIACWFAYDGAIGWPNKNRDAAIQKLQAPEPFGGQVKYDDLSDRPDKDEFDRLQASNPTTLKEVHDALGEPQHTSTEGRTKTTEYFLSRWGYAVVMRQSDRVRGTTLSWQPWYKTKADLQLQLVIAAIAALPGLYFLWRLRQAVALRVLIDDEGMTYAAQRIPFTAMTSLQDYSPKGWIDLYYEDGGRKHKLRLDNEKVLLFNEIVAAICDAKGFKNEVVAHAQEKDQREADEAAAAAAEDAADDAAAADYADEQAPDEDDQQK